jgi:LPXTG-motif cell wall-anchored protein
VGQHRATVAQQGDIKFGRTDDQLSTRVPAVLRLDPPKLSRCLLAALTIVALLCGPAVAAAQTTTAPPATQTTTIPENPANVSPQAPVQLDDGSGKPSGELPNTGTDPRLLFLAGVALTLLGVGLRLRTADADLY